MNENIKEIVNIIGNAELSNKCHKECFINTDFDNECTLCRQATALHRAGYRKRSETVKEFAVELLDKIQNGDWSENNIYRLGQLAMAGWVAKYIDELAERYGKEELWK